MKQWLTAAVALAGFSLSCETAQQTVELCSGSSRIEFAVARYPGGLVNEGDAVLAKNGSSYIALTGDCTLYTYRERSCGVGELRAAKLSTEQLALFKSDFHMTRWPDGEFCLSDVADYPTTVGWLSSRTLRLSGCTAKGEADGTSLQWLGDSVDKYAYSEPLGALVDQGSVFYALMDDYDSSAASRKSSALFSRAPLWPLSTPARELAQRRADLYQAGHVTADPLLGTDEDASALRGLRGITLDDSGCSKYSPVHDGDGLFYRLYQRDAHPLEREDGLVPFPWLKP